MNSIKKLAETQFIKKECNLGDPNVTAALIVVASLMANVSYFVSADEARECLCEVYKIKGTETEGIVNEYFDRAVNNIGNENEDQEVRIINDSIRDFVRSNIGFTDEFLNFGNATIAYDKKECVEGYNSLYVEIRDYMLKKENESIKTA